MSNTLKTSLEKFWEKTKKYCQRFLPLTGGSLSGELSVEKHFSVNANGMSNQYITFKRDNKTLGGIYTSTLNEVCLMANRNDNNIHGSFINLRCDDNNAEHEKGSILLVCRGSSGDGDRAVLGLYPNGDLMWYGHKIADKNGLVKS